MTLNKVSLGYKGIVYHEQFGGENTTLALDYGVVEGGVGYDAGKGKFKASVGASFIDATMKSHVGPVDASLTFRAGAKFGIELGGGDLKVDGGPVGFSVSMPDGTLLKPLDLKYADPAFVYNNYVPNVSTVEPISMSPTTATAQVEPPPPVQ